MNLSASACSGGNIGRASSQSFSRASAAHPNGSASFERPCERSGSSAHATREGRRFSAFWAAVGLASVVGVSGCGRKPLPVLSLEVPAPFTTCLAEGAEFLVGLPPKLSGDGGVSEGNEGPVAFGAEAGQAIVEGENFVFGVKMPGRSGKARVLRWNAVGLAENPEPKVLFEGEGDAPWPLISGGKLAFGYAKGNELLVAFESASAGSSPFVALTEPDESQAFSVGAGKFGPVLVWDETVEQKGRICLRTAQNGGERCPVVSPESADASVPTLLLDPTFGNHLVYLAEAPESERIEPDSGAGEPSQGEAFRWLEVQRLDESLKPVGEPTVLFTKKSHLHTYAATISGNELVVIAREDDKPMDGDGGRVWLVPGLKGKARLLTDVDVAPGKPGLLALATGLFGVVATKSGEVRLFPLGTPSPTNSPSAASSLEPALAGFRVLAARVSQAAQTVLLGARLRGAALGFQRFRCPR